MTNQAQAIEVEVVEIDGATPPVTFDRQDADQTPRQGREWQNWQGRVRQLDSRWWPLWVLLGVIAVVIFLTLGVVIGAVFLVYKFVSRVLWTVFG